MLCRCRWNIITGLEFIFASVAMIALSLIPLCLAHGRLIDPPSRASMWRLGFDSPADYDDHQGYCGGKDTLWKRFEGRCGVCGDPYYPVPRAHERGGPYYLGTPTRTYKRGDVIAVTVGITANHRGWIEFRLCTYDEPNDGDLEIDSSGDFVEVTQECLDRHLLTLEDGSTRYYLSEPYSSGEYVINVRLPRGLTCKKCLFQWKWNVGNSWGTDPDGESCVGCGEQEQFYACSDIVISSRQNSSRPRDKGKSSRRKSNKKNKKSRPNKGKSNRNKLRPANREQNDRSKDTTTMLYVTTQTLSTTQKPVEEPFWWFIQHVPLFFLSTNVGEYDKDNRNGDIDTKYVVQSKAAAQIPLSTTPAQTRPFITTSQPTTTSRRLSPSFWKWVTSFNPLFSKSITRSNNLPSGNNSISGRSKGRKNMLDPIIDGQIFNITNISRNSTEETFPSWWELFTKPVSGIFLHNIISDGDQSYNTSHNSDIVSNSQRQLNRGKYRHRRDVGTVVTESRSMHNVTPQDIGESITTTLRVSGQGNEFIFRSLNDRNNNKHREEISDYSRYTINNITDDHTFETSQYNEKQTQLHAIPNSVSSNRMEDYLGVVSQMPIPTTPGSTMKLMRTTYQSLQNDILFENNQEYINQQIKSKTHRRLYDAGQKVVYPVQEISNPELTIRDLYSFGSPLEAPIVSKTGGKMDTEHNRNKSHEMGIVNNTLSLIMTDNLAGPEVLRQQEVAARLESSYRSEFFNPLLTNSEESYTSSIFIQSELQSYSRKSQSMKVFAEIRDERNSQLRTSRSDTNTHNQSNVYQIASKEIHISNITNNSDSYISNQQNSTDKIVENDTAVPINKVKQNISSNRVLSKSQAVNNSEPSYIDKYITIVQTNTTIDDLTHYDNGTDIRNNDIHRSDITVTLRDQNVTTELSTFSKINNIFIVSEKKLHSKNHTRRLYHNTDSASNSSMEESDKNPTINITNTTLDFVKTFVNISKYEDSRSDVSDSLTQHQIIESHHNIATLTEAMHVENTSVISAHTATLDTSTATDTLNAGKTKTYLRKLQDMFPDSLLNDKRKLLLNRISRLSFSLKDLTKAIDEQNRTRDVSERILTGAQAGRDQAQNRQSTASSSFGETSSVDKHQSFGILDIVNDQAKSSSPENDDGDDNGREYVSVDLVHGGSGYVSGEGDHVDDTAGHTIENGGFESDVSGKKVANGDAIYKSSEWVSGETRATFDKGSSYRGHHFGDGWSHGHEIADNGQKGRYNQGDSRREDGIYKSNQKETINQGSGDSNNEDLGYGDHKNFIDENSDNDISESHHFQSSGHGSIADNAKDIDHGGGEGYYSEGSGDTTVYNHGSHYGRAGSNDKGFVRENCKSNSCTDSNGGGAKGSNVIDFGHRHCNDDVSAERGIHGNHKSFGHGIYKDSNDEDSDQAVFKTDYNEGSHHRGSEGGHVENSGEQSERVEIFNSRSVGDNDEDYVRRNGESTYDENYIYTSNYGEDSDYGGYGGIGEGSGYGDGSSYNRISILGDTDDDQREGLDHRAIQNNQYWRTRRGINDYSTSSRKIYQYEDKDGYGEVRNNHSHKNYVSFGKRKNTVIKRDKHIWDEKIVSNGKHEGGSGEKTKELCDGCKGYQVSHIEKNEGKGEIKEEFQHSRAKILKWRDKLSERRRGRDWEFYSRKRRKYNFGKVIGYDSITGIYKMIGTVPIKEPPRVQSNGRKAPHGGDNGRWKQ